MSGCESPTAALYNNILGIFLLVCAMIHFNLQDSEQIVGEELSFLYLFKLTAVEKHVMLLREWDIVLNNGYISV